MDNNTSIVKGSSGAGGCFSIISDRAQEAIAVLDTNGLVHYANAAWVRMHGYERRSEVVGKSISDFHNKEQLSADVLPFLQEVGRRGQISGPVGHMHKNGTMVATNTTMVALKDESGRMRGVIVFATDISETEQLKEDIKCLKREADNRTAELASAAAQLEERAKELMIVENLLRARGTELSSVNKKLWQYMSEKAQTLEQLQASGAKLTEKDKEAAELKSRLQRQNAEQMRLEQQWRTQYNELTTAIQQLRHAVIEMKHQEVEYLDGIDEDAEPVGAREGIDRDQLKQLSSMAKKFVSE